MKAVFDSILELSIQASWIILAVIAARFLLKSAPKWLRCSLWALVALRLLCPVSLESPFSLVPESEPVIEAISRQAMPEPVRNVQFADLPEGDKMHVYYRDEQGNDQMAEVYQKRDGSIVLASSTEPLLTDYLPYIWIAGMTVMVLNAAVSYLRLKKKVGPSMDLGNGVYLCDYVGTPFILGILRPVIYLPSELDPNSAQHVLSHEKAHLRRKDHWWKPLGYVLLCIHWFNPLVWAAYILLCRDIELACDEKVIRELGPVDKKAYSEALLRCTVSRKLLLACPLAFGEVGVKQRIKSVLTYKKPGFWILLGSILVIAAVAVGFLTEPEKPVLSDLCPVERENVICIDFMAEKGYCCMGTEDFLAEAWDVLDSVKYDPEQQFTGEFDLEDANFHLNTINFDFGEESKQIYLSRDYSQLIPEWDKPFDQKTGTYEYYPVKNPEKLKAFCEIYVDIVYNREVTAQPFAQMGQPHEWSQGLRADAMSWVRMEYATARNSSTGGYLSRVAYEELEEVLKTVPASAFSGPEILKNAWITGLTAYLSDDPNLVITFQDMANDLGVIIRYYEENDGPHLEFIMVDGAYAITGDNYGYERDVMKWNIDSPELLEWFRKNSSQPPWANLRSGHWMEFDEDRGYITVSNGEAKIRVRSFAGWDYEVVEPAENCEHFGIRIRHPEQTEGSIYVSFWPDGHENTEINRYFSTSYHGYSSYPLDVLYPNGVDTKDRIFTVSATYYETGDYVVLNEGADDCIQEYAEEIRIQLQYCSIQTGEQITKEAPEMVVDLEYTQCEDPKHAFVQIEMNTADRAYMSLGGQSESIPCGWMYDDSPEGESVLFTYWPEYMTEGYVAVEYHEGFFQPPEGMTIEEDDVYIYSYGGAHPAKRGTLPGDDQWTYLWIDRRNGSYVFRFENTEHWDKRRIEECIWALNTFQFRG